MTLGSRAPSLNLRKQGSLNIGSRRVGASGPAIAGISPSLAQTTTGSNLSDFVTWGRATAPDGETLTGASPVREMDINGAGWVPYVGATALVDLETVQTRETWSVVGDAVPARTFNSVVRITVRALAVNTVAPVASGSTSLGGVLSVTTGTWTGAVGGAFSYQWKRDGEAIGGATASSYMILEADDAADLTCDVAYTNSGGASVPAGSNAVTVDDFAIPVITGAPTITGMEAVGSTLTASPAPVAGNPIPARTWQWVNSASGDISGATSSTYTLQASDEGDTITVRQVETNALAGGTDTATSAATGAIAEAPTAAVVTEVTVGAYNSGTNSLPITVTATGATNGVDSAYWIIYPAADADPTAVQVRAGQKTGDAAATDDGSYVWPDTTIAAASGIADASYKLAVVLDNGALSNVLVSTAFTLDTTAAALSAQTASESSGDIIWGVTSNEAVGTIYAGLRLASDGVLSASVLIAGTGGDLVDNDSDATPTADAANGGTFTAPADGTYRVDMVQVDDFGNVSAVVSSGDVAVAPAGLTQIKLAERSATTNGFFTAGNVDTVVDFTGVAEGDKLVVAIGGEVLSAGYVIELRNGGGSIGTFALVGSQTGSSTQNRVGYLHLDCPAAAAGQASITWRVNTASALNRPFFSAVLSHISGAVGSLTTATNTTATLAAGATLSASLATTVGGVIYAITTGSGVGDTGSNLTLQDGAGMTGNLDAVILLHSKAGGTDDVYRVSVDNDTATETRTIEAKSNSASSMFEVSIALLFVPSA